MDQMVLKVQQWLNFTYGYRKGFNLIEEDGYTGWGTIGALITALQFELGVESPNGVFGPTTTQLYKDKIGSLSTNSIVERTNLNRIVQGALYCKGYDPKEFSDVFSSSTESAIKLLQNDAGITQTGLVDVVLLKSLLSMNAFKLLQFGDYDGKDTIREVQRYLNKNYISNIYFSSNVGLVPCDGMYGRTTNKALIYALQIEENISEPNGVFGPATSDGCLPIPSETRDPKRVYLLQAALYCNGFDPNGFDGSFGNGAKNAVMKFQEFCNLSIDGSAGPQTWKSLLTSTGDPLRKGKACDTTDTITQERAKFLIADGRSYVGRYLTGKFRITSDELDTIYSNNLKLIPIMQVLGWENYHFSTSSGNRDALDAISVALFNQFSENTVIYFAIDFDALSTDIPLYIEPYFKSIKKIFDDPILNPKKYRIGVYAPRAICSTLYKKGYSVSSYVSGMSSGFDGNIGAPLPENWSFDQIYEYPDGVGNGNSHLALDNVIARTGHEEFCSSVNTKYSLENLNKTINDHPFFKCMGLNFTGLGSLVFYEDLMFKCSISASRTVSLGEENSSSITISNGKFDSINFKDSLTKLSTSLSASGAATLSEKLKIFNDQEITVSMTTSPDYIKFKISAPPIDNKDVAPFPITLSLNIEIKKLDSISIKELATTTYSKLSQMAYNTANGLVYIGKIVLCIVASALVIYVLSNGIVAALSAIAVGSAFSGTVIAGVIIVLLLTILNEPFKDSDQIN